MLHEVAELCWRAMQIMFVFVVIWRLDNIERHVEKIRKRIEEPEEE